MSDESSSALLALILLPVSALVTTWVLYTLWGWYAVPVGLPAVTMKTAYGFDLLITLLTFHAAPNAENAKDVPWRQIVKRIWTFSIVFPLSTLLLGWIVFRFL